MTSYSTDFLLGLNDGQLLAAVAVVYPHRHPVASRGGTLAGGWALTED